MAQGDLTKEFEYDKIEVVSQWNIQVRQATKVMEEQADGSKKELTRSFHRSVLVPFVTTYSTDSSGKKTYTHIDTNLSGEDASNNSTFFCFRAFLIVDLRTLSKCALSFRFFPVHNPESHQLFKSTELRR